ncbi:MAG: hypothetical protein HY659_13355 [Rhizobiales bacterium]|nr:hypothetical protein [Hyphomicrobiales bacterium]
MTRIIILLAALVTGAVLAFSVPADAAQRKADGFRNAEQIDVSAHRRHYRYYRYHPRYYYGPRFYYGAPYPYYYRPYRYHYAPWPFWPWW